MNLPVVFFSLVLLLLSALSFYLMRHGWPAWLLRRNAPRKLQVSEIRSLGNRQFLVIAEYEATRLFLGVSQGRIDLLCHLGRDVPEEGGFASLMQKEIKP
jgi:flagellar biogenesis protein FliO